MKFKFFIVLISLALLVSCEDNRYQKGYDYGYQQGRTESYAVGFKEGETEGYDKGYADGKQLKNKDVKISDRKVQLFDEYSFKIFSVVFYFILIIFLVFALVVSTFYHNSSENKTLGKVLFLIVGLGLSFLTFKFFNIANLVFLQTDKSWMLILVNFLCFLGAILLTWFLGILLENKNDANDVFIIMFSTFFLFHLLFFLTNIETFLMNNSFFATCIISTALGGLIQTAYKIVFQTDDKIVIQVDDEIVNQADRNIVYRADRK